MKSTVKIHHLSTLLALMITQDTSNHSLPKQNTKKLKANQPTKQPGGPINDREYLSPGKTATELGWGGAPGSHLQTGGEDSVNFSAFLLHPKNYSQWFISLLTIFFF